jgi:hypothetical protein
MGKVVFMKYDKAQEFKLRVQYGRDEAWCWLQHKKCEKNLGNFTIDNLGDINKEAEKHLEVCSA